MQFTPRKLLFKAWNRETRLLMRLNTIECVKGELVRDDHILLQFTGLLDCQNEEIYEMDILLIGAEKVVVFWSAEENRWMLRSFPEGRHLRPWVAGQAGKARRICSYFESGDQSNAT